MEGFKDGGSEIGVARVGMHSHLEEEGGYVETASTPPHIGKGKLPPKENRGSFYVGCKWDFQG